LWLHSLKVAQLLRSAACLHTNQSRSYLNHLVTTSPILILLVLFLYIYIYIYMCSRTFATSVFINFRVLAHLGYSWRGYIKRTPSGAPKVEFYHIDWRPPRRQCNLPCTYNLTSLKNRIPPRLVISSIAYRKHIGLAVKVIVSKCKLEYFQHITASLRNHPVS